MAFVIIPDILEQARDISLDWQIFLTSRILAKDKSVKYTYVVQKVKPNVYGFKFQLTGIQGSFIILEKMCLNQELGKWKGENVILSFYILTAVELEDSALNLLPRIEKWYLSLKVVNIQGT